MDAFYICYSMPFDIHRKLGPYRFFLANRFIDNAFMGRPLLAFGCFPAKRHERYPYGLRMAETLLGNSETVVIFPEGRISKIDREHVPRHGVEVLAKMPGVQLVPARVEWQRDKGFFKSYRLSIGRPFNGSELTAEQIMDKVYDLKF
jgi:1-acyl-sn-glycerol-3-phosphate acyltransferase